MSLLSYSSPWINDNSERNNNTVSKKRTPTLGGIPRKTIKVRPNNDLVSNQYEIYNTNESPENKSDNYPSQIPESIDDHNEKQLERTTKINSILNQITSFSEDSKLVDFNPLPYPTNITKKNTDQILTADKQLNNGENPLMPKTGKPEYTSNSSQLPKPTYYRASEPEIASKYASYRDAYGKEGLTGQMKEPYYAKMGISKGNEFSGDKVMDRLNYITQMLVSIQMEKTNHVTEEFVLYSLLGVFMIYIVDGFSRSAKYVR